MRAQPAPPREGPREAEPAAASHRRPEAAPTKDAEEPKKRRRGKPEPRHRKSRNQPEPERITREEYLRQLAERAGGLHPYDSNDERSEWHSR